jgi:hypothetical protein
MTTAEIRAAVLSAVPQARYMNLSNEVDGPCHCIDDDYNDRYLAYGCPNRRRAWYEALAKIQGIPLGVKTRRER